MKKVYIDRFWKNLMTISEITLPEQPYTRRSFSAKFLEGREWLSQKFKDAGLTVFVDAAGNLIGRKEGKNPELGTLMLGSHSDTVPTGGRFDGIAGVIAALEVAQSLQDYGITLDHNLEIVDFLAEEPSEWGISCIGSRGITGNLPDPDSILHPLTQESLSSAIARMGGDVSKLAIRKDIKCFLELHIEQGIKLETLSLDVGIVTGIVGIKRFQLEFVGKANHAGTTPMEIRTDALLAAATGIQAINKYTLKLADDFTKHYLIATCGQIQCYPNATNVIPGRVEVSLDVRSNEESVLQLYTAQSIEQLLLNAFAAADLAAQINVKPISQTSPSLCTKSVVDSLEQQAKKLKYKTIKMPSGAGHDTAFLSQIAATAMIFVPSRDGLSHHPDEWTSSLELDKGINVLFNALLEMDKFKYKPAPKKKK